MNLRLHQLKALIGAIDYGGIRAAARELHLSQAALTKSLRELEEDAGCALLIRSARGVQLTPAGLALVARARAALRQLAAAQAELTQFRDESVLDLKVALTPVIGNGCFSQAFLAFRKRYPRVVLELSQGLMSESLPRLRDGSLDWAVAFDNDDIPLSEFQIRVLANAPQHIVARQDHPVFQDLSVERLAQQEWLLAGPHDARKARRVQSLFASSGLRVTPQVIHAEPMIGLNLLRHTDVVGMVPAALLDAPEAKGLRVVNVPELCPPVTRLVLVSRPDLPMTVPAQFLADCLEQTIIQEDFSSMPRKRTNP